jgi:RNA polymerase sigma-70 factor (ECF subfamily)
MLQDLGDRAQWLARNVLPHEALVRSKLRNICRYDLDIEDVIQEMYARILTRPGLEGIRYPRQYALLTAKGVIIDHIRHSRVISITSTDDLELLDIAEGGASVEERLEFQSEVVEVADALAQLPGRCRETVILRRIEGLSQKEVAQRLQISEKTVEKYMTQGMRLLMRIFGRGGRSVANPTNRREQTRTDDVNQQPGD